MTACTPGSSSSRHMVEISSATRTSWLSGVASRLRAKAVSSSRCKGFKERGGASDRWHITSTDIHEASFPCLNSVIPRCFTYAVAFHGFDEPTTDVRYLTSSR